MVVYSGSVSALDALKQPKRSTLPDAVDVNPAQLTTVKPAFNIPIDELKSAQRWCRRALIAMAKTAVANAKHVTVLGSSGEYSCQTVIEQLRVRGF